jgi:hypothetical protein
MEMIMCRLKQNKYLGMAALAIGIMAGNGASYADQPAGVAWKIVEAEREGIAQAGDTPRGDAHLLVHFRPWDLKQQSPLLVLFRNCGQDPEIVGKPVINLESFLVGKDPSPLYNPDWKAPGARWRICPDVDALLVSPNSTSPQQVAFEVDFLRLSNEGMSPRLDLDVYEVSPSDLRIWPTADELARHYRNKPPSGRVPLSVHYRLSQGNWKFGSYAAVYGDPRSGVKGTGNYLRGAKLIPVNIDSFRRKLNIPTFRSFDKLASVKTAMDETKRRGSGQEGDQICYPEQANTADIQGVQSLAGVSHTLSGRFSTKWSTDHSLHSGFGFLVEAYRADTLARLGAAWVQANGQWVIQVPSTAGFSGGNIRVYYRSYNSYFAPQNQAGNKYSWADPIWTVTGSTFNTGHRYADTDGGSYNGVGELVDNAMTMWSRLYWDAGINPVPASPIKFYFPNTFYNCGGSSPWSCATFAGDKIWLIAEHGVQGDVVNHEMGHALQSKFWSGKSAANSGGSHSLNGCYPTRLGMALGEGFANFMAAWVGYPGRNVAEGGFNSGRWALGWDAEQRTTPPNCANGWENEVWVARTFWDLHDTRADGDDILWFNYAGGVISLFLGNGVANNGDARDMRFYETIYRNAASAGHADFITDIFEQNHH